MLARRRSSRHLSFFALAMLFAVGGCSYAYQCEVSGKVRSFPDGAPLEGVRIELKDPHFSPHDPVTTGLDGSFAMTYRASDIAFDPGKKWTATLSKDGYREEVVDIKPPQRPDSGSMVVCIVISASMTAN